VNAYDLPTSLVIGEVAYPIRYGWRAVLDAISACSDQTLDDALKAYCMIRIMFPDWKEIPAERLQEACEKACEFIDCGQKRDDTPKPKLIDWDLDAAVIIPEINKVAGREVRMDPNIHWWTFFGWFMGIGDGLLASVLHIRTKKAKGQKLEKWEQEFYKSNKALVDMKEPETEEIREEKNRILKMLDGG
jgi:hypothetical protein